MFSSDNSCCDKIHHFISQHFKIVVVHGEGVHLDVVGREKYECHHGREALCLAFIKKSRLYPLVKELGKQVLLLLAGHVVDFFDFAGIATKECAIAVVGRFGLRICGGNHLKSFL